MAKGGYARERAARAALGRTDGVLRERAVRPTYSDGALETALFFLPPTHLAQERESGSADLFGQACEKALIFLLPKLV